MKANLTLSDSGSEVLVKLAERLNLSKSAAVEAAVAYLTEALNRGHKPTCEPASKERRSEQIPTPVPAREPVTEKPEPHAREPAPNPDPTHEDGLPDAVLVDKALKQYRTGFPSDAAWRAYLKVNQGHWTPL
jgi:hypothetical protein